MSEPWNPNDRGDYEMRAAEAAWAVSAERKRADLETELARLRSEAARFHSEGCPHSTTVLVGNCCEGNDLALGWRRARDGHAAAAKAEAEVARLTEERDEMRRLLDLFVIRSSSEPSVPVSTALINEARAVLHRLRGGDATP